MLRIETYFACCCFDFLDFQTGFLTIRSIPTRHGKFEELPHFTLNSTPLHIAVQEGHLEICRLLLQCNAEMEARDEKWVDLNPEPKPIPPVLTILVLRMF